MAASVVITSGTGAGEESRSESQIESTSLRSSISHSVHKNSAPPRPGGHGPGMMPMRYLIVMVRDRTRRSGARQGIGRSAESELTASPRTRQGRGRPASRLSARRRDPPPSGGASERPRSTILSESGGGPGRYRGDPPPE